MGSLEFIPGFLLLHILFVGKGLGTLYQRVYFYYSSVKVRKGGKVVGHKQDRRPPMALLEGPTEIIYMFNLGWALVAFIFWQFGFQGKVAYYGNAVYEIIWTTSLVWIAAILMGSGFLSEFIASLEDRFNKYTITGIIWAGYYFLFQFLAALFTSYVDDWSFWLSGVGIVIFSLFFTNTEKK